MKKKFKKEELFEVKLSQKKSILYSGDFSTCFMQIKEDFRPVRHEKYCPEDLKFILGVSGVKVKKTRNYLCMPF